MLSLGTDTDATAALRKPDLPTAPRALDLRKVKDPAKRAAKQTAHDILLAEYKEKKREYDEVLFPAYEQAYHRAYNQSEQRKRQRQREREEHQAAAAEALVATEAADLEARERQEREAVEREAAEREAAEQRRQALAQRAQDWYDFDGRPADGPLHGIREWRSRKAPFYRHERCTVPGCEPDDWGYCDHRLAPFGYTVETAPRYETHVLNRPAYTNGLRTRRCCKCQWTDGPAPSHYSWECLTSLHTVRELPPGDRPGYELAWTAAFRAYELHYHGHFVEAEVEYKLALELRRPEHECRYPEDCRVKISQLHLEKALELCRCAAARWAGSAPPPPVPLPDAYQYSQTSLQGKHWWRVCVRWPDGARGTARMTRR
jgi:hypothetical protein